MQIVFDTIVVRSFKTHPHNKDKLPLTQNYRSQFSKKLNRYAFYKITGYLHINEGFFISVQKFSELSADEQRQYVACYEYELQLEKNIFINIRANFVDIRFTKLYVGGLDLKSKLIQVISKLIDLEILTGEASQIVKKFKVYSVEINIIPKYNGYYLYEHLHKKNFNEYKRIYSTKYLKGFSSRKTKIKMYSMTAKSETRNHVKSSDQFKIEITILNPCISIQFIHVQNYTTAVLRSWQYIYSRLSRSARYRLRKLDKQVISFSK